MLGQCKLEAIAPKLYKQWPEIDGIYQISTALVKHEAAEMPCKTVAPSRPASHGPSSDEAT